LTALQDELRDMQKRYLSANELLNDSFALALQIIASGFRPDLVIGIWRGGSPVAITVQETLEFAGFPCDHIAIRTSSYHGIGVPGPVSVYGLDYLSEHPRARAILLVDDVYDTGLSVAQVLEDMRQHYGAWNPDIRIATPWYKPGNNRTLREPDYWLHSTDSWLVFPHELQGLTAAEVANKPVSTQIAMRLAALRTTPTTKN